MEDLLHCPLCKSGRFLVFTKVKDHAISKETFTICHCTKCKLHFTNKRPTESTIAPYYASENYTSHQDEGKSFKTWLYKRVRHLNLQKKVSYLNSLATANKKLLDVGSGLGYLPEAARRAGWEVSAYEPNAQARQKIIQKGIPIEEDLRQLSTNSYDVITLYHVLEHIHELKPTIKRLRKALIEGGYLIVAVPNHDAYERSYYRENWAAYDVPRHLYHFNIDSIHYLCDKFKFELVAQEQMPFDSFYVSLLSETYQHPEVSPFKHYLNAFIMGFRSYWQAKKNIRSASSIQYTLKKI